MKTSSSAKTDRSPGRRPEETPIILVGAENPLPPEYVWFESDAYSIYAAEQPRSAWGEHTHDCLQVTVGLEPAHVHAEWRTSAQASSRRELIGNAVSIIPPGQPHRTLWQRRASLIHIYITRGLLASIAGHTRATSGFGLRPVHLVRDPLIEELGRALHRECAAHTIEKHFADALITVLVTHLLRTYSASLDQPSDFRGGLGPARDRRVRNYIEQFPERDLSIQALAKVAGLNPHYFAQRFHQSTGFTPHQYVSRRRVERAQELLAGSRLTLAEVAFRSGFTSQSQFTTLFRRFTGLTPGRFRSESHSGGLAGVDSGSGVPARPPQHNETPQAR